MDATEQLVFDSEICVGVLGNGRDFVLIRIGDVDPLDQPAIEAAIAKGYFYCGALGLKNGEAAAQCEPHLDCISTMMHAGLAFAHLVADRLREQQPKGDGAEFLAQLFAWTIRARTKD
jgi:hypothetical protein